MFVSPVGLGTKNLGAGEDQQQFSSQSVNLVAVMSWLRPSGVVRQYPATKNISTKEEETTLPRAVTRQQLVKTQKTLCELQYRDS
jgi:hypothetical protein